jgi:hypothetical protein
MLPNDACFRFGLMENGFRMRRSLDTFSSSLMDDA